MSFQDKTASATATYGAGILCLIFSSLPLFQSFDILGMKGVLKEKIEEADELIEHLKAFSVPTTKLLISNLARSGRMGAKLPRQESYELCNEIVASMRKYGVEEADIEIAKRDWHRFNLFDMAQPLFQGIGTFIEPEKAKIQEELKILPQPIKEEDRDKYSKIINCQNEISKWEKAYSNLRQQEDLFSLATEIEKQVQDCPFVENAEKEKFLSCNNEELEDLKYYAQNRQFRRMDVWFSGK